MTHRLLGAVASAALALAAAASAAEWSTVRIGIEGHYPPFSEIAPDGSLKGFDVDIARALCEQMQVECALVQLDWDEIQDALLGGEIDAIVASMSITIARKQRLDFTNRYYHTPGRLVGRPPAEEPPEPPTFAELVTERRVGVQAGTVHERFLREKLDRTTAIVPYATLDAATAALLQGEVELVFADAMSSAVGFLRTRRGEGFTFLGPPITDATYFGEGIAMAVRMEDQDLRYKLNRALDEIRASGTYGRLMEQYFGFDINGS
jgi:arginine/ornithine transport system substrate-binding protein